MKHGKTLKRISALLVALLLLPAFAVAAETQTSSLTVPNGDFQKGTEAWEMPRTEDAYEVVTDGDNQYLRIKKPTNVSSFAVDIAVGETYVWSFDVHAEKQTRAYIRFVNSNGDNVSAGEVQQYISSTNGWRTFKMIATAPPDTCGMRVMLNVYGVDDSIPVEYDNFSVEKLNPESKEMVANGNLEEIADGMPKGITVSGNGVRVNENGGHSGKAIEITTNEVETVTLTTAWFALAKGVSYDISAYMNLTNLTDESTGICLELYKIDAVLNYSLVSATSYFKATAYADSTPMGWRKMMIPISTVATSGLYEIRVTFTGQGTVFVDDLAAVPFDGIIRNGDFEGFTADFKPAGAWKFVGEWGEDAPQCILRDANGSHYLRIGYGDVSQASPTGIFTEIELEQGVRYVAETDGRGGDYDCKMYIISVFDYNRTGASANEGKDWTEDYRYYFTINETKTYQFSLSDRNGYDYSSFDNVEISSVMDVADTLTITEKDGTVTATFEGFGTDYTDATKNRTVSVILARYLVTGTIFTGQKTALDAFEIVEGQATSVPYNQALITTTTQFGEVPLVLPVTMEKPDAPANGTYKYRAFAVDATNRLLPYLHAVGL